MTECIHCGATDDREHGIVIGLIGDLNETVCNICRAHELQETTAFKRREAEVYALKEQGYGHSKIAEFLGIKKATVDTYSRRINDRVERSRNTLNIVSTPESK